MTAAMAVHESKRVFQRRTVGRSPRTRPRTAQSHSGPRLGNFLTMNGVTALSLQREGTTLMTCSCPASELEMSLQMKRTGCGRNDGGKRTFQWARRDFSDFSLAESLSLFFFFFESHHSSTMTQDRPSSYNTAHTPLTPKTAMDVVNGIP